MQASFPYFCPVEFLNKYETVVGLEVHAQLSTKSKVFCSDSTAFGAAPNTQVSEISLAHPGTLPFMNQQVIADAVRLGLALNCSINQSCYFERKNYFYPDLPKGYQVTQQAKPICVGGFLMIGEGKNAKKIRLNRIHMEEDAGKSLHDSADAYTNIDLNRAGIPLLEIVSEADIRSGQEALEYLTELRKLVRWLDVCDGNMEQGSMRCDANISVRLKGSSTLGTRVEVKNLNSIRNVKRAIEVESNRLMQLLEQGRQIVQETRSYDADNNATFALRSKEDADDYRYFPEPDLPGFLISKEYLDEISRNLPQLPSAVKINYQAAYSLSEYDANLLTADKDICTFFESVIKYTINYKDAANWIGGPLKFYANENEIEFNRFPLSAQTIAELIDIAASGQVHFNNASTKLLNALLENPGESPAGIAQQLQLIQESDTSAVEKWIDEVLGNLPDKVLEYKKGKKNLRGLFAGEVKKLSKGKADMQLVDKLLLQKLNK